MPQKDCYAFVDGQYVRCELLRGGQPEEFDPRKPAVFVRNHRIAGEQVSATRVFYYDAVDREAEQAEQERQSAYFSTLQKLPDTHVILGEVRRGTRTREQKGVDVQLAVDALRAATSGVVKAIALVTGDADFAPLARAIRDAGPHVIVIAFRSSLAESLAKEADRLQIFDSVPMDWGLPSADHLSDPI